MPAPIAHVVFQAIGELLDNACTHADSDIGAFAAAQTYTGELSRRPGLELAVADSGMGVPTHLRRNQHLRYLKTSAEALSAALLPGISGTGQRRGNGLPDVVRGARLGWGSLLIRSEDAGVRVDFGPRTERTSAFQTRSCIPGTWVWLRLQEQSWVNRDPDLLHAPENRARTPRSSRR